MRFDAIVEGRVAEIEPDVSRRNCDACVETMCGGKRFDHGGGQAATSTPVTMLKQRHRPGEAPYRKHLDLVGKCSDLRAKSDLNSSRQAGDRCGELADHVGTGKGGAEPKEPQSGGRHALWGKATQIRCPFAGQDVTQNVVDDDD